jgi:hypothetical protein
MKQLPIEKLAENVNALVKTAPREKILLTRNGKPFAFVSDASKYDWEDIGYMADPEFWKMIQERRKEPTIPFEQVKAEFLAKEKKAKTAATIRKSRQKHQKPSAA